jgi:competence protein ComGC
MISRKPLIFSILIFAASCQKKNEHIDETSSLAPAATNSPTQTAASEAKDPDTSAILTELTQKVRRYGLEQRQAPKNLEELVSKGYLPTVPKAPPGKRFAINKNLEVYLTDL